MTREIKFRAWDLEEKKERSIQYIEFWTGGMRVALWDGILVETRENGEGLALMQYTGLKDKIGKEICEGDVVKSRHGIASVAFHNASFIFKWDFSTLNELMHVWKEDGVVQVEVIGNIYETPNY
jgi:uncharacterized phage protein (TIGR01671 family)